MLKTFLCILALAGPLLPAQAQKMFAEDKYNAACSYYGETITGDIMAYGADKSTETVVKNILSVIGLRPNFELRAANVPNAAAVILKDKRYILYNPKFMENINTASGTNWAAISILAHEIGHHLNGHTLDKVGSRPDTELEADEFSGFVLRRLGATLSEAQAVMTIIASLKGSHTHPAKSDRLKYIAAGWTNAGQGAFSNSAVAENKTDEMIEKPAVPKNPQVMKKTEAVAVRKEAVRRQPVKKPAVRQVAVRRPVTKSVPVKKSNAVLADKYIVSDAYFNADPNGKYYITTKGHLVQVDNNNIYMIGRLAQSNKEGYSLMLSDKQYNYMYIGQGGAIVNGTGKRVGQIKIRD